MSGRRDSRLGDTECGFRQATAHPFHSQRFVDPKNLDSLRRHVCREHENKRLLLRTGDDIIPGGALLMR